MSSPVDLLFERAPLGNPAALVFGEGASLLPDVDASFVGTMPALTLRADVSPSDAATFVGTLPPVSLIAQATGFDEASLVGTIPALSLAGAVAALEDATFVGILPALAFHADVVRFEEATLVATLPALAFGAAANYDSQASRPTVGSRVSQHQQARSAQTGWQQAWQLGAGVPAGWEVSATELSGLAGVVRSGYASGDRLSAPAPISFEAARQLGRWGTTSDFQSTRRHRASAEGVFENATPVGITRLTDYRDLDRRRSMVLSDYDGALALHRSILHRYTEARGLGLLRRGRYQEAVPPNGGKYVPPVPPDLNSCYTPSGDLVYASPWSANTSLLFICENHDGPVNPEPPAATVVVPIRSVYIVFNDIILRRVSNNLALPVTSLSLSIDADSWTWGFSASLPATSLQDVLGESNDPIELEAVINGNGYRLIAEGIARERQFGRASIRVSGRGRNAILAAPYAPVMTFANSEQRTAQQLMLDALTINGQPMGWDIEWGLTDWLVPAGAFNVQGTYIDALNAVAGAAGAYLQPHPTTQTLRVLLRYPIAPWAWAGATPDYEIPNSVMTRESIEWVDKPAYDRVFVSGTGQGVLAQVTRDGTAGGLVAPMVTDALITDYDAARQRGLAVLSDTGRQATVRLSLPVLAETGIITPGKFVRYVDGTTTRIGLVRAVGVEASGSAANLRQVVTLETHP